MFLHGSPGASAREICEVESPDCRAPFCFLLEDGAEPCPRVALPVLTASSSE